MPDRTAEAVWEGALVQGRGRVRLGSGQFEGPYTFASRFENGPETNPEELIAAAHAGCYSMALAAGLGRAGYRPEQIRTTATVRVEKVGEGFQITSIRLRTEAKVPGIDEGAFQEQASRAKVSCPVSKALEAVDIELEASLAS